VRLSFSLAAGFWASTWGRRVVLLGYIRYATCQGEHANRKTKNKKQNPPKKVDVLRAACQIMLFSFFPPFSFSSTVSLYFPFKTYLKYLGLGSVSVKHRRENVGCME